MIRKHTSFFDPSLQYLQGKEFLFENARGFCAKLIELVQDLSILGMANDGEKDGHNSFFGWLIRRLAACFGNSESYDFFFDKKGQNHDESLIREFVKAVKRVHRLESVFRYPIDDSDWDESVGHRVYQRRFFLGVKFYAKGERKPFYVMEFMFGDTSNVYYLSRPDQPAS